MAEHEGVKKDKKGDEDRKRRNRQNKPESSFDQSLAWDTGQSSLTETPFYPRMDEHATILSRIPTATQRNNFIMQLHQTYGNRYVQRLMESINVQAKLSISDPGDIYEQEADRVADAVTRAINSPAQRQEEELEMKPILQRQEEEEVQTKSNNSIQKQDEEEELQAQLTENEPASVSESLEKRINSACGSGQPLSENVHEPMEGAFGADFSDVRVHTDSEADALNQKLMAKAFTTGPDIFFKRGAYDPATSSGRKLIAHELTHVVQQGIMRLSKGSGGITDRPIGTALEREADTLAQLAVDIGQSSGIQRIYDEKGIEIFKKNYPQYAHLLNGITKKMTDGERINKLLANFLARKDFEYTGSREPGQWQAEGDCSNVALDFKELCKTCFNLDMDVEATKDTLVRDTPSKIVDKRGLTGNVDGGQFWIFTNGHVWLSWKGIPIDVLFGEAGLIEHDTAEEKEITKGQLPYWEFGDKNIYVKRGAKDITEWYTTSEEERAKNRAEM